MGPLLRCLILFACHSPLYTHPQTLAGTPLHVLGHGCGHKPDTCTAHPRLPGAWHALGTLPPPVSRILPVAGQWRTHGFRQSQTEKRLSKMGIRGMRRWYQDALREGAYPMIVDVEMVWNPSMSRPFCCANRHVLCLVLPGDHTLRSYEIKKVGTQHRMRAYFCTAAFIDPPADIPVEATWDTLVSGLPP